MTQPTAWQALDKEYNQLATTHLRELFKLDPQRFEKFSLSAAGLKLDFSKNRITEHTLDLLIQCAEQANLAYHIKDLFLGKPINVTENRPALHTALRDPAAAPQLHIQQSLAAMTEWVEKLQHQHWSGFSQKPITDVVNLGIGGSFLGPLLVTQALAPYHTHQLRMHFMSSLDEYQLHETLSTLNPETTLFILASKSFSTEETLVNAGRAKAWLLQAAGDEENLWRHFLAVTANPEKAIAFGVHESCILTFGEWVGGRYSLWSTMGLPIALAIGMARFKELLAGAHALDQHFCTAPLRHNMPVIMALLGFWYLDFFKAETQAILPYDYRLRSLPRYLQQLDMESNGKSIQLNGTAVSYPTAPIVFGEPGTEGQHSFHQLLFQGTHLVPCDFIAILKTHTPEQKQPLLFANCLAQSRGLMQGKTTAEATQELIAKGYSEQQAKLLAPHQMIPGNQPSNTLLLEQLTPHSLGALIALYEHKIFVQGVLWNINSFDQWGVELGKQIAEQVAKDLQSGQADLMNYDASTLGLMRCYTGR